MFVRSLCARAGSATNACSRVNMPLRAKVLNSALVGNNRAQMTTSSSQASTSSISKEFKERKEDAKEDVLFTSKFGVRTIELNRPAKLNSLNGSMVRKIVPRLLEWQKSDMANVIIMKGAGHKALCAGGDVAALARDIAENKEIGSARSTHYFGLEYKLDHLIATYKKPYISIMDGFTMGGGVGLSIHAPFRIATERTVFAMPETTIGFFPDVGASFFLPRMPGAVGTYLALTSEQLRGVNAYYAGIATHYVHSSSLPALEARLAELRFPDYAEYEERLPLIDSTIEEYVSGLPHDEPMLLAGEIREAIDRCFGLSSVPEILEALKAETGSTQEWAQKTLATLHKRSPTSVYVTLRQMQLGKDWHLREAFKREYGIAAKFMKHPDFVEGVSARLIRKDEPKWQPASLEEMTPENNTTEDFFKPDESVKPLELLTLGDYKMYPHSEYGLPHENQVRTLVSTGEYSASGVVKFFEERKKGKQGVKQVVQEILKRKTRQESGQLMWLS